MIGVPSHLCFTTSLIKTKRRGIILEEAHFFLLSSLVPSSILTSAEWPGRTFKNTERCKTKREIRKGDILAVVTSGARGGLSKLRR